MRMNTIAVLAGLLALPAAASSTVLEGHFTGRADHPSGGAPGTPGVYVPGESYTAYMTLTTVQENPWYPWNQGAFQYTAVLNASVSSYNGASNPQTVTWTSATVAIYEDATTPADYTNVSTFTDGTMILGGSIFSMAGQRINNFGQPWAVGGQITLTTGPGLPNVAPQCDGNMVMNDFINFQLPPGAWPDDDGYEEGYDAKWECPETTGIGEATWGRVKASYR